MLGLIDFNSMAEMEDYYVDQHAIDRAEELASRYARMVACRAQRQAFNEAFDQIYHAAYERSLPHARRQFDDEMRPSEEELRIDHLEFEIDELRAKVRKLQAKVRRLKRSA